MTQKASHTDLIKKDLMRCIKNRCVRSGQTQNHYGLKFIFGEWFSGKHLKSADSEVLSNMNDKVFTLDKFKFFLFLMWFRKRRSLIQIFLFSGCFPTLIFQFLWLNNVALFYIQVLDNWYFLLSFLLSVRLIEKTLKE